MTDKILEEKELRVADAKRKFHVLHLESQELKRSPLVKEYFHLIAKCRQGLTSEEDARLDEIQALPDLMEHFDNLDARHQVHEELKAATKDLEAYRRNNPARQALDSVQVQNRPSDGATASDSKFTTFSNFLIYFQLIPPQRSTADVSPNSDVPSGDTFSNQGKLEAQSVQPQVPASELRHRKVGGNPKGRWRSGLRELFKQKT